MQIAYQVAWAQPNSHYFDVTVTVTNPGAGPTAFRIPAWRPGRYRIENYTRNVIQFAAADGAGATLNFRKLDKDTWEVPHGAIKRIVVTYRYYANVLDAGSSYLDDREAYLNPVTMLMYLPGREHLPVSIRFPNPQGWRVVTALDIDPVTGAYPAADYHELADSPFLISPDVEVLEFEYRHARFEIALQGKADADLQKLIGDIREIVRVQSELFGDIPFKRYVFLYHLVPFRISHGVEHKNSTSIVRGPVDFSSPEFYFGLLGFTSHEFFHVWNVERIRPAAIYYPDYSRENYTTGMWFYEGVTSYYDMLTLCRAGLISRYAFYNDLQRVINGFEKSPGRKLNSPAMTSWDSWGREQDPPPNTTVSFYRSGQLLGLLLDLEIRGRTANAQSLDAVMRYLYRNYAQKDIGVPEDGIQQAIEAVAGSSFEAFFRDFVYGTEDIDYNAFLPHAGLELVEDVDSGTPAAYLGIRLSGDSRESLIANVFPASPALEAGLAVGDVLLALDGQRAHADNLDRLLQPYHPGDKITLTVFRREELRRFEVLLGGGKNTVLNLWESPEASDAQIRLRDGWLGGE